MYYLYYIDNDYRMNKTWHFKYIFQVFLNLYKDHRKVLREAYRLCHLALKLYSGLWSNICNEKIYYVHDNYLTCNLYE